MTFPVYIQIGLIKLHPHLVFESLGYLIAFRLLLKHNLKTDTIPFSQRSSVIIGAILGAVLGAKSLAFLQHLDLLKDYQNLLILFLSGKTIVGGLLGGLIGVEITKKIIGITRSTGDVFVYPLIYAIAIGRIGCFLTGLSDRTYGIPTTLPWGIDFGDGIPRHPTQIYEIIFLVLLATFLNIRNHYHLKEGDRFKFFMIGYLGFRFLIDFIKPDYLMFLGLSAIQIACFLGLIYYYPSWLKMFKFKPIYTKNKEQKE